MPDGPAEVDPQSLKDLLARETERREHAEEAVRTAEQEKAAILDAVSEAIVGLDEKLNIVWANRAAAEAARTTPLRLIGRRCHHGLLHRLNKCDGCPAERARQTGEPHEGEVTARRGAKWHSRAHPIRDAEGRVAGIVEILTRVSAQRASENGSVSQ